MSKLFSSSNNTSASLERIRFQIWYMSSVQVFEHTGLFPVEPWTSEGFGLHFCTFHHVSRWLSHGEAYNRTMCSWSLFVLHNHKDSVRNSMHEMNHRSSRQATPQASWFPNLLIPTAACRAKELRCRILHWWLSRVTDTVASGCHLRNASKHFICKWLVLKAFLGTSYRALRQKTANISVKAYPPWYTLYNYFIFDHGSHFTRCRCGLQEKYDTGI